MQTLIAAQDLRKEYRTRDAGALLALQSMSFTVREGEFVAVVGPSGCGKSTLLKILAGLEPRTGGDLQLGGRPVDRPRRDIGMVFQAPVLLPWRTVLQNVMLPVEVQNLEPVSHQKRARELLAMVGLEGFEGRYPHELSGGMQQRAAIARGLIHDPAILLMDEPFGALDAMTREHMNVELQRIWQQSGKTVIFITHSIAEAVFLADRVFVMTPRPGRLAEIVDVDLPRRRELELMNTQPFGTYVSHIREHFQAKGVIG